MVSRAKDFACLSCVSLFLNVAVRIIRLRRPQDKRSQPLDSSYPLGTSVVASSMIAEA